MSGLLQIDLSALAHNYQLLQGGLGGNLAAVVKADAYGLGADEVATALWAEGCREFFVAQAAEGVALRSALPDAQRTSVGPCKPSKMRFWQRMPLR